MNVLFSILLRPTVKSRYFTSLGFPYSLPRFALSAKCYYKVANLSVDDTLKPNMIDIMNRLFHLTVQQLSTSFQAALITPLLHSVCACAQNFRLKVDSYHCIKQITRRRNHQPCVLASQMICDSSTATEIIDSELRRLDTDITVLQKILTQHVAGEGYPEDILHPFGFTLWQLSFIVIPVSISEY